MYSTFNIKYPQLKWISIMSYTVHGPVTRLQAATCYPHTPARHTLVAGRPVSSFMIWLSLAFRNMLQPEPNNELTK